VVLLKELKERGYSGGYTLVKDYLQPKRQAAKEVATRRFETPPGQQAQVDWGEIGTLEAGGETRKLYAFVMTLGHSRAMLCDLATDQRLGTLLQMHERAFEALGGVPNEILYDWMKTVALGTDERGEVRWQSAFRDFADYWGFTPRLCRPYRPQTKGKVESGVGYLRKNFLCGREATDFEDLRSQLRIWRSEVAHRRVHGTTHRIVEDAWQEEKPHLQSREGRLPYPYEPMETRKVARDAYINYRANRYSVPWQLVGQSIAVQEKGETLEFYRNTEAGRERVAVHGYSSEKRKVFTQTERFDGMAFSAAGRRGKPKIAVSSAAPVVEVRSLAVYEQWAEEAA
jgi:transposase